MELNEAVFEPHTGPGRNPWRLLPGLMLSGAGQCVESVFAMTLALGDNNKPALIALYESLQDTGYKPNVSVMEAAHLFPGVILQLGLQLPLFNIKGLMNIAAGRADAHIARMANRYASLPCPVLLRIGYEFDGTDWNGYEPRMYAAAYRRIARVLESARNVALVWDSYTTDVPNVMDWYPGDDVVDWFGYNTLSPKFDCGRMRSLADEHGKPLLNGEASYAMDAEGWHFDRWIKDYFSSMRAHGVQAYQYINWRWQVYPKNASWYHWQDGRITEDPSRMTAFLAAMAGPGLVVRGNEYSQPLRLVADCARALEDGAPEAPWKKRDDFLTALPGYALWPEGASSVYGDGWQCGWAGDNITLHIRTPEDFSGALLINPACGESACFQVNGRKVYWHEGDGFVRLHDLPSGDTQVHVVGCNGQAVILQTAALLAYSKDVEKVRKISFSNGLLSWEEAEDAAFYSVYADGVLIRHTSEPRCPVSRSFAHAAVSAHDTKRGEGRPAIYAKGANHA